MFDLPHITIEGVRQHGTEKVPVFPEQLLPAENYCGKKIVITAVILLKIKNTIMGVLRQIAEYLYLKKRDPNEPRTQWMKYMHGMNRLSILIFLIALIIMLIRLVIIPMFR